MCNNGLYNSNCGCGNDSWWIIILIAICLICFCGWGNNGTSIGGCNECC